MKLAIALNFLVMVSIATAHIKTTLYNSIDEFKAENPGATLIKMNALDYEVNGGRSYSLGQRQTGDAVVANSSNKKTWPVAQNVTTTLSYPSSGQGAFLTYVLIHCEQSSNLGTAYVTAGGVGQHGIQIIVEAQLTTYFNYSAFFYGIK